MACQIKVGGHVQDVRDCSFNQGSKSPSFLTYASKPNPCRGGGHNVAPALYFMSTSYGFRCRSTRVAGICNLGLKIAWIASL